MNNKCEGKCQLKGSYYKTECKQKWIKTKDLSNESETE